MTVAIKEYKSSQKSVDLARLFFIWYFLREAIFYIKIKDVYNLINKDIQKFK